MTAAAAPQPVLAALSIDEVIQRVFELENVKHMGLVGARAEEIRALIKSAINGDSVINSLALSANLSKDSRGALVYVLTDRRVVTFQIDKSEVKSASFPLNKLSSIERNLEGDRALIRLVFDQTGFGLRYSVEEHKITDFFQQVDQASKQLVGA